VREGEVNGRGPVVGEEPVQRTKRFEVTVIGSPKSASLGNNFTLQLSDYAGVRL
jgi:hypothetical protein